MTSPLLRAAVLGAATFVASAHGATHPTVPIVDAATINAQCDTQLAAFRKTVSTMEAKAGSAGIFDEWNLLSIAVDDFGSPIGAATNLSTDKATREAADACTAKLTPFSTEVFQSERLYARVKNAKPATAVQGEYRKWLLDNFEDAGVTLPADKRARAKAINDRLTALGLEFDKNVRDDATTVVFRPDEVTGFPESYLSVQKRDGAGNYVLPLTYPAYRPFMDLARSGDARKRYWTAMINKGGAQNLPLLDESMTLRRELAGLYGDPDFATFQLRRRMAGNPQAVHAFLGDVRNAVTELEKKDLEALRNLKADDLKQPDARMFRWDVAYYQEKLKKARYDVDQEALRKYFPTDASVAYVMKVAETLYGIRFAARDVPVWHPSAKSYDVYEAGASGRFIGSIYLDLFPREGKYGHAHAETARAESALAKRTPIAVLVANLNDQGLNQDELVTLMHEFGHVLHIVLSKARYLDQSGGSVKWDFVEAPSQMFEEWARREDALKLFASVCTTCPQLTSQQIDRLESARKVGLGLRYARQLQLATFDMALTGPRPAAALDTWAKIEGDSPLGYESGSMFPANFTHLMDGYAAGYYGYMWSEVLALDMLSGFHGKLMNPVDGRRYRTDILENGGQVPPERMIEKFLGRKPSSDAFFKEIAGRR